MIARRTRNRAGFTLLETLVALAILGTAIVAVLQLLGTSARSAAQVQAATSGLFVAEEIMEEILALGETELLARAGASRRYSPTSARRDAARNDPDLDAVHAAGVAYDLRVTRDRRDDAMYEIALTVTWQRPRPGRVDLATLQRFTPTYVPPAP